MSYGYASEVRKTVLFTRSLFLRTKVVLICLVVVFGLLFLFMVVKYYRLRTSIGDYQLQQVGAVL